MKNDFEVQEKLKNFSQELRQQTFWGLMPEMPKWEFDELGAYLPAISLPAFIDSLTVKNGVMGYAVTSFDQFTKHIELYEINATIEEFKTNLQVIIESQTEKDFFQNLLKVLQTEVYFMKEWKE